MTQKLFIKKLNVLNIGIFFIFWVFALVLASSCQTTKSPTQKQEISTEIVKEAPKELEVIPETEKVFTRAAFAEQLSILLSENKRAEALALFDTVPEPDASDPEIKKLKLSIMIAHGMLSDSAEIANALEKEDPKNPEIAYMQAMIATAKNDQTNRTKYLNQVLQYDPNNSSAMTGLGLDYLGKKNYSQAKKLLLKAVSTDKNNTDALLGLSKVYYMENELDKAETSLNLAISKEPNYSLLWTELARIKSETNNLAGALEDMKKAVSLDPTIYGQWVDYGNYLISAAKKEEAREAFSQAIAIDSKQYLAYIYRAGLNDELGYTEDAVKDYQIICNLYPQYYYAAESLGVLLWKNKNWDGSRAAFQQALYYNPKNTSYALMATICLYKDNKTQEAKKFMSQYLPTLDRNTTDYFLCRLFVDLSGDTDVLNRITKEKNANTRSRMLFYAAMYYDLFLNQSIAQKYYIEVLSNKTPSFFEFRLSEWALQDMNLSQMTPADQNCIKSS